MVIKTAGISFIVLGLIMSILDRIICRQLCETCSSQQLSPCYFLFLFVGIIFIVNGASLIITNLEGKKIDNFYK
ncbi:hypothetical protein GF386_04700 [Candidatus Pacearchaeota archaeon]|nr:hypothetical protein [Candidatus Pacearchaeota archaeon]MBD3283416.1 hypothetical protein [Candidatus Pacearchaeota archaeon]